ncbi:MAG: hypothetical protein WCH58_04490 [Candidatus Saccharibacteria bacterium]
MSVLQYFADTTKLDVGGSGVNIPILSADNVLGSALNIAYFTAGAVAVIVIILSGYSFMTAVYDPAKVEKARNAILYAVVGLIVVITAFVITNFVIGSLK